jgi:CheY-like chemotaxis protein
MGPATSRSDGADPLATLQSNMGKLRAGLGEMTSIVETLCALKPGSNEEALIEVAMIAQRHAAVMRELEANISTCEESAAALRDQVRRAKGSDAPTSSGVGAISEPVIVQEPPADAPASVEEEGPVTQVDPRSRRVLVVDDEPAVLRAFRRVLQRSYEVVTARSGSEALRIVLTDSHLDGILCDLAMPELDGPAFFAELKELCPQLLPRVVFITGGIATEKSQHFVEGLETPVLQKPVTADALLEALAEIGS